jgi:hypothetical protein
MESIGADYGAGKSAACESIQWAEDALTKDKTFRLPDKKALKKNTPAIEYIVVDVTESPINRPKKKQKDWYSGKKKRHTIKTQIIIERKTRNIIDVWEAKGGTHDFKIYKDTIGKSVHQSIHIDAGLGYQGIEKLHPKSRIPKKNGKNRKLTKADKAFNKRLARKRIVIEHVNAKIKTFKCMAYPYRNHCRRHLLRMSLICGIINFELCL